MEKWLDNDLVSVIIPVYNSEKYVEKAICSVIRQAYGNIEIIVIDDGSTDRSSEIIKKLISQNSFIRYYQMEKNSGVAIARNTGIALAKGRYIAFLDSDDMWVPGKLKVQMKLFERYKGIPFSYTAIKMIDENDNELKGIRRVKERITYQYILRNTMIATSTVIIDRHVVSRIIMPSRRSAEDYSLWLTILKKHHEAYGINEALTLYRKSNNSVSANKIGEVKHFFAVQTEDMKINKVQAGFNTCCYIINAVKKHFF